MNNKLPNMLDNTIAKIREMVDVNTVVGTPITVTEGVTIIPISTVSIGLAGGGSDYVSKHANNQDNPFGGGIGAGIKLTPMAFLVVKDNTVRLLPMATPANTAADRLVEMLPEALDRIADFVDSRKEKKPE